MGLIGQFNLDRITPGCFVQVSINDYFPTNLRQFDAHGMGSSTAKNRRYKS